MSIEGGGGGGEASLWEAVAERAGTMLRDDYLSLYLFTMVNRLFFVE